jgi:putative glutamine amidotransferase
VNASNGAAPRLPVGDIPADDGRAGDRPVIGLSSYAEPASWGRWVDRPAALLAVNYVAQVTAAGGVPVLLPPVPGIATMLPRLDALVLSGGADIDPAAYGAQPHPRTGPIQPERDAAEFALLAAALEQGLPVLAICRGLQVLNVSFGGTLHQHLPDLVANDSHRSAPNSFGTHDVRVARRSRLGALLGPPDAGGELRLTVPTSHHQAVDRLGDGLVATAWADDGTIEAVEPGPAGARGHREQFLLAVQWHPEAGADPRLFQALLAAARAYRDDPGAAGTGRRASAQPLDSRA